MVEAKDKAGQTIYINHTPDCEYNEGGYYCETYSDEDCDHKIDDFCIHTDDCDCEDEGAVLEYMSHYYDDEVLDLNFDFDNN